MGLGRRDSSLKCLWNTADVLIQLGLEFGFLGLVIILHKEA